ncbi:hypothetical protein ACHAP7_008978 [Fusarium lateritium]
MEARSQEAKQQAPESPFTGGLLQSLAESEVEQRLFWNHGETDKSGIHHVCYHLSKSAALAGLRKTKEDIECSVCED